MQRQWWQSRPSWAVWPLLPFSALYLLVSGWQRWLGHRWARRQTPLRAPVLVVGNLIVGGAGKTPTTMALVQALRQRGWHPGVVSRGYGRQSDTLLEVTSTTPANEAGDEPLLIHLRTGAPLCVGRDRHAAAQALLSAHPEVDLLVADDGLQHTRLPRTASVVVFDARGAGNGLPLPAGPLRELLPCRWPAPSLTPCQVIYNAERPSTRLPGHCARRQLAGAVSLAQWWQGLPADPACLHTLIERSRQTPLLACAAIAEPERFFRQLEQAGMCIRRLPLPDHDSLNIAPWPAEDVDVLITEKDAVKLPPERHQVRPRLWVVALDFQLPEEAIHALDRALRNDSSSHP
nr:tetraacyldisaccharide 4'-kinase [Ideonella oryzae]